MTCHLIATPYILTSGRGPGDLERRSERQSWFSVCRRGLAAEVEGRAPVCDLITVRVELRFAAAGQKDQSVVLKGCEPESPSLTMPWLFSQRPEAFPPSFLSCRVGCRVGTYVGMCLRPLVNSAELCCWAVVQYAG